MKNIILFISIILMIVVPVNAQATSQTDVEKARRLEKERQYNDRVDALRNNGKTNIVRDRYKNSETYILKIKPLYKNISKEQALLLAPDSQFSTTFAGFLSQKNTGLIKLMSDKGCDKGTQIVNASPHCIKYKMPGAGSTYSFRTGNYHVKHLGDITFADKSFQTAGILKHGILINIGDVSLEDVNIQMEQLKTLVGFQPVKDLEKAENLAVQLDKGIQGSDFLYKSSLPVEENKTYILRSIAYRGNNFKSFESVEYDEFEFDERKDIIVAFRVVKVDENESVTILWKELSNQKSPKLN